MVNKPVRLAKQNTTSWESTLQRYSPYILLILIIVLLILIIATIIAVAHMGGSNVTMVESGNYYNHFQDVI